MSPDNYERFDLRKFPDTKPDRIKASYGLDVFLQQGVRNKEANTQQEIHKVQRVVCGSKYIKDAADAKVILEALGLFEGEK